MSEIDDLLAQIKTEYETEQQPQKSLPAQLKPQQEEQKTSLLDNLLAEVKQEVEEQITKPKQDLLSNHSDRSNSDIFTLRLDSDLISQVQQEFQEKEKIEQQRQQQQLQEEKQRQQKQEQRRRQELEKQAKEWLKNLKPNSDESVWFTEFSYAYESKLEAAIDYLQAMRETRFLG
jgi:acetylglutamate synthase